MSVTTTPKLGLETPDKGDLDWRPQYLNSMNALEARLTKTGTADPNVGEQGHFVGQTYWDSANKLLWRCSAVGNPGTWVMEHLNGAGDPNGVLGGLLGQRYWDTTNKSHYTCTTAGAVGVAVWSPDFPAKMIVMWAGLVGSIPLGWLLCDGTSGTPDLSGKFIVGYDAGDSDYDTTDPITSPDEGGEKEHTLTIAEIPAHAHSIPVHSQDASQNYVRSSQSDPSGTATTSSTGGGDPHENRPPYYTLAYIMKA